MEIVRNHRDIKLITNETKNNFLVSEQNYHNFFLENLLAIEMKRAQIPMNRAVYLGLSIEKLSKIVMYELWYNYVKPKYEEKTKLSYMDTDSFILYIKSTRYLRRHCEIC